MKIVITLIAALFALSAVASDTIVPVANTNSTAPAAKQSVVQKNKKKKTKKTKKGSSKPAAAAPAGQ